MNNIRPTQDYVLIQREAAEERTHGGIIIPENAKERPAKGKVLAVGKGRLLESGRFVETTVKVGDRVLFGKYSGTDATRDSDPPILVRESEILAVLED